MTGYQWFTLVQTVVMALAAAGVALLHRGFSTGKWVQTIEGRDAQIAAINTRLDRAGQQMSDLATDVQGLPDRLRREFVSREVFEIEKTVTREARNDLREDFRREDTKIWDELRRRRS